MWLIKFHNLKKTRSHVLPMHSAVKHQCLQRTELDPSKSLWLSVKLQHSSCFFCGTLWHKNTTIDNGWNCLTTRQERCMFANAWCVHSWHFLTTAPNVPQSNIRMTKVVCCQQTHPPMLVDICLGLMSYINHCSPPLALVNQPLLALTNHERSLTMVHHDSPWLTIIDQSSITPLRAPAFAARSCSMRFSRSNFSRYKRWKICKVGGWLVGGFPGMSDWWEGRIIDHHYYYY